jgi:ABC-type amino acid transport substrate-binding protein
MRGSDISLLRNIAKALGVDAVFLREAQTFDEIVDLVSRGEADVGVGTSITLARAKKATYTKPYMILKQALLVNRLRLLDQGVTSELRDLEVIRNTKQKIGVMKGSAYITYAKRQFPMAELVAFGSLQELRKGVEDGELLAAVRNDLTAKLYMHRHPALALRIQLFVDEHTNDYVALCVGPESSHLLSWLNSYILIKEINLRSEALVEKYQGSK